MLLLALDTSSPKGSCAVVRDGALLSERTWIRDRSHGEFVVGAIDDVLREADAKIAALDGLAVGVGPGSFTGIRVALSAAKAIAYAASKPVYAFDACELLAEGAPADSRPLLTLVEANRDLVYVAAFSAERARVWPTRAMPAKSVVEAAQPGPWACVGARAAFADTNKSYLFWPFASDADHPGAVAAARLAERAAASGARPFDWNSAQPLYVRASEAEEKLKE